MRASLIHSLSAGSKQSVGCDTRASLPSLEKLSLAEVVSVRVTVNVNVVLCFLLVLVGGVVKGGDSCLLPLLFT